MDDTQVFSFSAYSLLPPDLIPLDDAEDAGVDVQWLEYCRIASSIDRARILECVLSARFCQN